MANWIIIALFAQFLYALVSLLDKILITKTNFKPVSYAFYTGIFQALALVLIPFGFSMPESSYILIGLIGGSIYILGLITLYRAIQFSEISRIVPIAGGTSAIIIFFLAYFFLGERLSANQVAAFLLFITGGFLLSSKFDKGKITAIRGLALAIAAAFIFSIYYVLTKLLFMKVSFLSAFIPLQFGGFMGAVILLLSSKNREMIFKAPLDINKKTMLLFFPNKVLAAVSGILVYYAISLGSVTIVNSLQASQYAFLLLLAIIFSKKFPELLKEQTNKSVIFQKILAILLIGMGLFVLQK